MNNRVEQFINEACTIRGVGQTTWLLEAALNNPNCILVFANSSSKDHAMRQYKKLKLEAWDRLPFYKKWFLQKDKWINQKVTPIFMTIGQSITGHRRPIFFDSSCFPLFIQNKQL